MRVKYVKLESLSRLNLIAEALNLLPFSVGLEIVFYKTHQPLKSD